MAKKYLGAVAVTHKGNFNPSETYEILDEVYGNNGTISGSFRSKIDNNTQPLSNDAAWGLVSKNGDDGERGMGFIHQGNVDDYSDLEALALTLNNTTDVQKAWTNLDDGLLYTWSGTSFEPNGQGLPAEDTQEEIKTKYESNANTNAFTDTEKDKLNNIQPGAEVNPVLKTINGIELEGTGNISAERPINEWDDIGYEVGVKVYKDGFFYESINETLSTDIPGVSSNWLNISNPIKMIEIKKYSVGEKVLDSSGEQFVAVKNINTGEGLETPDAFKKLALTNSNVYTFSGTYKN